MKNPIKLFAIIFSLVLIWSCTKKDEPINKPPIETQTHNLTIFIVNDQHARLNNFEKIKYIVDKEEQNTEVIVACGGDIFSGNPVVDNHAEKGYPMIDVMNECGFDVAVVGNHEFDYGEDILDDRFKQSDFSWICANVDMSGTNVTEPLEYVSIATDSLKITFVGFIETNGKPGEVIPSTHPWKVQNFTFQKYEDVIAQYSNVKQKESADLYIALTHLGHYSDFNIANNYPYFDLIIGGHSHWVIDTTVNNIPVFQAGSYLNYLGKIKLRIKDKELVSTDFELIDLDGYTNFDAGLKAKIDDYTDSPELDEVIGYSGINHLAGYNVGCFYTDALRIKMDVDVSFQNSGGIRDNLDEGDITKREIYAIAPFNNGTVIYTMTVAEIKDFLKGSASGFYYSGIIAEQDGDAVVIKDEGGLVLDDNMSLVVGLNDYIPAVYEDYFPSNGEVQSLTAAETIIAYLQNTNESVFYPECGRYFKYNN